MPGLRVGRPLSADFVGAGGCLLLAGQGDLAAEKSAASAAGALGAHHPQRLCARGRGQVREVGVFQG